MTTATLPVRARRSGDAGTGHGSAGAATTPTAAEATITEPMIWAADAGWKDDFRRLWAALGVSLLGLEVTAFALPLTAALVLGATPLQMGLLAAAGQAPFLLLSLPAGAWVDRRRRRPLLIASDLGRLALLLSVPIAAALGVLGFGQLCLVAFGLGALGVLFDVAHYAYVPALVPRRELVASNSRIQVCYSVAGAAGPSLGGALVGVVAAPFALVANAAAFLASALFLGRIRRPEAAPATPVGAAPSATTGIRFLLGHPLLRPIVLASMVLEAASGATVALFLFFLTRDLGTDPLLAGAVVALGGAAAVGGATAAARIARRVGVGPAIVGGWVVAGAAGIVGVAVAGPSAGALALLALAQAARGAAEVVANIHQWSLRQAVTPDALQGRVTAAHRFLVYGAGAAGALLAGGLASAFGARTALLIWAVAATLAPLPTLATPLRRLREQPGPSPDV